MDTIRVQECLTHLRLADDILLAEREQTLAAHLSLVIELLAERVHSG